MEIIDNLTFPIVLQIIGFLFLFYWFFYKPTKVTIHWLTSFCNSSEILKPETDDFAVITGSTGGIGLEYSRQLAEKGYNLLLLSQSELKLEKVSKQILAEFPACKRVEYLAVDFSKTDIYKRIDAKIKSLNAYYHVLVNNVGIMPPVPEYFIKHPEGYHLKLINVNIVAMTLMSEMVLKLMVKQKADPKRLARGVVINLSSMAGMSEFPMLSTYSASKCYINYVSKILASEHAVDNIIVQTVTPGIVETALSTNYREKVITVSAKDFVRHALKTVGSEQQTNGYPIHKFCNGLTVFLVSMMNDWIGMPFKFALSKRTRAKNDRKVQPVIP